MEIPGRSVVKKAQPFPVIAFDCDGVMFDTREINRAYYNEILRHFGKPDMDDHQLELAHMHMADTVMAMLFPDPQELAEAQAYRLAMPYMPHLDKMVMEPELKPLLQRLRPARKTAIATNRTTTIGDVLRAFSLTEDFDLVVSARDVERAKPWPDMLIRIIETFSCNPPEVLYIGDSMLDQQAAEAAGVSFAAYRNPELSADFHIDSLQEVDRLLR